MTTIPADATMADVLSLTRKRIASMQHANDNAPAPHPTKLETPLAKAIREGRLTNTQALVAAIVEDEHERYERRGGIPLHASRVTNGHAGLGVAVQYSQDLAEPVGQEIAADAGRELGKFREAADELWPAVYMATMERATMEAIGRHYCQPIRRASREGVRMVAAGLERINTHCIGLEPLGVDLLIAVNQNAPSVTHERM